MRRSEFLALCVAASAFLPATALSQESVSIQDAKLGDYWFGPKLNAEDLKGRIVLLELWGLK